MHINSQVVVEITANTEKFTVAIEKATEAAKEFNRALRSLPWYVRLWFVICSRIS